MNSQPDCYLWETAKWLQQTVECFPLSWKFSSDVFSSIKKLKMCQPWASRYFGNVTSLEGWSCSKETLFLSLWLSDLREYSPRNWFLRNFLLWKEENLKPCAKERSVAPGDIYTGVRWPSVGSTWPCWDDGQHHDQNYLAANNFGPLLEPYLRARRLVGRECWSSLSS